MSLTAGTRLGVYEVLGLLGAGGMGEVYRARDTRLNRDVALKVLPDVFASDPERMARFEREAQVLASLNHPHIATVFGLEESQPDQGTRVRALAMELVAGETLADRIARGPLPVPEAIALATQIAEALEAAHEQGIVHRDLKPANIHVTPAGSVKVLDFGLAKLVAPPDAAASGSARHSSALSMSPTITSPAMATTVGVLLGTAAYMSPEQAKGREAGPRSDIWAFGCVVYEMLTGQSPFRSDDVTETLAAILMREPDWTRLPAATPINLERLLKRCLRRDQAQRLHAIADARLELADAPLLPSAQRDPGAPPRSRAAALVPWGVAAAMLVLAGVLGALLMRTSPDAAPGPLRFSIAPPADVTLDDILAVITPDGKGVVIAYERAGVRQLFLRRLDQLDPVPIPGTERVQNVFLSPDSRWIAFVQGGRLRKVAIDGGAPIDIAPSTGGQGGTWSETDSIVFTPSYAAGLSEVAAGGGTPRTLTAPVTKDGELGHWWPQFLPGGRTVLFTNYRVPSDTSRIDAYSLDTGERRTIVERGIYGRYLPTGHLLFVRSNTVFAVPFDAANLMVTGTEVPILDGVATDAESAFAYFSVSSTGTLAYIAESDFNVPTQLTWVDRTGMASPSGIEARRFREPALSPDGRTVAATVLEKGETDIWLADISRGNVRRLTDAPGTQRAPVWLPDGRLLYASEEPAYHVYRQSVGAASPPERLVDGPYDSLPWSVLPKGEGVLFTQSNPVTGSDIWLRPLTGDTKPRPIVQGRFNETMPRLSPDGRWLAYVSDESGRGEVYAQAFPGGEGGIQVSTAGGIEPSWSADSRQLFFHASDQMMMVDVQAGSPLTVSRPTMLFQMPLRNGYSVAGDGRFLVVQRDPRARPTPVHIVLNWFDELRARVPVP